MEIVFFLALPDEAQSVTSSDDLPRDPAADPIVVDGPAALLELGVALGLEDKPVMRQLRDATCQSFPIWALSDTLCGRLGALEDEEIDPSAEAWRPNPSSDLHERASCLTALRDALGSCEDGETLFALFEERAF
jgi:hypothetical protein